MDKATARRWLPRLGWFALTSLGGGGCDLGTKAWAEGALAELPGRSMMVVEPWLELALTYNRGTAFSVIPDLGAVRVLFALLALAVVVFLVVTVVRSNGDRTEALALGAIAGGALGNGIDRAVRLSPGGGTGVVDFVKLNYPWGGSWPTFNVADALIAIGVGIFVLRRIRSGKAPEPAEST
jgi:lipoprotein signal peptidase